MNKTKLIYLILTFVIFCFGLGVWYQQRETDLSVRQFFKTYRIKKSDVTYKTVDSSFWGEGLIFYRVQLPQIALTHKIDKIIVSEKENEINLQLIGIDIDVIDTLRRSQNIKILSELKKYQPFEDALKKPLQTLAVLGIDSVKANVTLSFEPFQEVVIINGKITLPQLADIYFSTAIARTIDKGYQKNLIYTFYGQVEDIFFEVRDKGIFKKYKEYVQGLGFAGDSPEMQALTSGKPIARKMRLEVPLSLTNIYHSVPREKSIPTF